MTSSICGCRGISAKSAPAHDSNRGQPDTKATCCQCCSEQTKSYRVGTLRESFDHLECTLPGDHGAEVVGKLEGVVTEVLHNAITTIDDGEETPASGMGDVVDLAHDLDDWLVEADL